MENEVLVNVQLRVLVVDWMDEPKYDRPEQIAATVVRDALAPHVHSESDWDNRYWIIPRERGPVIVTTERIPDVPADMKRVRFNATVGRATLIETWEADVPAHLEGEELREEIDSRLSNGDVVRLVEEESGNEEERELDADSIEVIS